ncbi:hypothetical protein HK102_009184 [Quaeritorhiza haematococci]|nr:hypothetical protein HK102_009184 [Quaeritorhiza haematococci]
MDSPNTSTSAMDSTIPLHRRLRYQFDDTVRSTSTALVARGLPAIDPDRLGSSPWLSWVSSGLCATGILRGLLGKPGWPGYFSMVAATGIFGASGAAVAIDSENGPSIATGKKKSDHLAT